MTSCADYSHPGNTNRIFTWCICKPFQKTMPFKRVRLISFTSQISIIYTYIDIWCVCKPVQQTMLPYRIKPTNCIYLVCLRARAKNNYLHISGPLLFMPVRPFDPRIKIQTVLIPGIRKHTGMNKHGARTSNNDFPRTHATKTMQLHYLC